MNKKLILIGAGLVLLLILGFLMVNKEQKIKTPTETVKTQSPVSPELDKELNDLDQLMEEDSKLEDLDESSIPEL